MKILRADQQEVLDKNCDALARGILRTLNVMPTGSGKTLVAANLIQAAIEAGHIVHFHVNRDALILQSYEEFMGLGMKTGIFAGTHKQNPEAQVKVVSAQTLESRDGVVPGPPPTMIVADEAHLVAYAAALQQYFNNPRIPIIGFTATPYRLNSAQEMGDKFNHLITGLLPYQMIEMGLLKKPIYFNLAEKYNIKDESSIAFLIQKWKELALGRKTICFTSGVKRAFAIAKAFTEAGIPFAAIDGEIPSKQRVEIYKKLETNELMGLVSVDALSEGFDAPCISCVMLDNDSKSEGKYVQRVGRGMRRYEGIYDCIVIDTGGVTARFGGVEEKMEYSLVKSTEKNAGLVPKKVCPECDALMFAFCTECERCKYKFPRESMPLLSPEERMIQMVVPKEKRLAVMAYRTARRKAYRRNQSLAKVEKQFESVSVVKEYTTGAIFQGRSTVKDQTSFMEYLSQRALKENYDDTWVQKEFLREFGFA